jgi:hypothetical protein
MSKAGRKIIKGAREALELARSGKADRRARERLHLRVVLPKAALRAARVFLKRELGLITHPGKARRYRVILGKIERALGE